ncbi:hypothetical protein HCN51_35900 [Nonomuraea sp. FMUSA5-5]|uniref:Uncharacterized protein n=1 Tax=Nonomuraea composti TaxID=2720023 RepID=A0ABX1BHJ7_9ACTN|nr:hypothetical protein [Nonomuraea sp. FMUSA5-5]NJP94761.1 hypothetical protein [Nonomuraea sp. FMUSA5-5]
MLLLRRLLALLTIGLAHFVLLWQGEILTFYAVAGLIALLPSTWLPRWAVAALAAILLMAALLAGGFYTMVPVLFLLGSALVRYDLIARIESSAGVPAVLAVLFAAGTAPALWMQTGAEDPRLARLGCPALAAVDAVGPGDQQTDPVALLEEVVLWQRQPRDLAVRAGWRRLDHVRHRVPAAPPFSFFGGEDELHVVSAVANQALSRCPVHNRAPAVAAAFVWSGESMAASAALRASGATASADLRSS